MAKTTKATEAAETASTADMEISSAAAAKTAANGHSEATGASSAVTYSASEFAKAAATIFERPVHQDIVTGAFLMAGKKEATKEEAAKLVSEFLGKEIKLK